MIKRSTKFELHYYFTDDSHSMSAIVRNECEREILHILKAIQNEIGIEFNTESESFVEGGLKEWWRLIGKNSAQITLILAVITVILSRLPVENKKLVGLQIENLKLDNEIKRQELKKLKNQAVGPNDITQELVEEIVDKLENDYKVIWHKSNFYKKLNSYPKVKQISTILLDEKNKPTQQERTVTRYDFAQFIIQSNRLEPFIDENAIIYIISPVLLNGNFNWKGIYNGQIIGFEMKDSEFKKSVLNRKIEFVNGSAIKCILQQNKKIDDIGNVQVVSNHVLRVFEILSFEKKIEMPEVSKRSRKKKNDNSQMKLDL